MDRIRKKFALTLLLVTNLSLAALPVGRAGAEESQPAKGLEVRGTPTFFGGGSVHVGVPTVADLDALAKR